MAHIVKKNISGKDYFYLNKSIREGDKVKTKSIAYLGKDKDEAEKKAQEIIEKMKKAEAFSLSRSDNLKMKKGEEIRIEEKSKTSTAAKTEEKINGKPLATDDIATFCKRRGFVYPSSEIYGGFAGFWDFGPIGVELFNNIKQSWWKFFIHDKENMVGIEASIISHPTTWKASGHIASFSDIAVICKKCKKATKIDKSELGKVKCECGGEFESQGEFNLLFKTRVGALNALDAYLRGETAQGMFMDFKLITETSRVKLPFGIGQIGRCFRNEIAPRDFLFRSREFNIAEFEFFIHPEEKKCSALDNNHLNLPLRLLNAETQSKGKEDLTKTTIGEMLKQSKLDEWHAYWLAEQVLWFKSLGLNMEKIKIREHTKQELSHYSSATFDLDYEYPFGSKELAGNANRGQYDLTQHQKESKQNLEIFDEETKKKVLPRVIEPTFGMERVFLAIISDAYTYDKTRENIVLKLHPKLAPYKIAVFPLINRLEEPAKELFNKLKSEFHAFYDKSGSIGRRYARQDEIGTPYCITVDFDGLKDDSATIRDRDTIKQIRVPVKELKTIIAKLLNKEITLDKAGKVIN